MFFGKFTSNLQHFWADRVVGPYRSRVNYQLPPGALPAHALQQACFRPLRRVVGLVVSVVGGGWVVDAFFERGAELVLVGEGEFEIVRPAGRSDTRRRS